MDDGMPLVLEEVGSSHDMSTSGTGLGDDIATALRKQGIKYTHHNDKILVENPAERIRTKQAVQVC